MARAAHSGFQGFGKQIRYHTFDHEHRVFETESWLYTLTDDLATLYGYDSFGDYATYHGDPFGDNDETNSENEDALQKPIDITSQAQLDGHAVTAMAFHGYHYSFSGDFDFPTADIYGNVTIPDSVTKIEGNPFQDAFFSNINTSPKNPVYESMDGVLFDKHQKRLIAYPSARTGAYVIPEGTISIGDHAFSGCKGIIFFSQEKSRNARSIALS